MVTFIAQIAAKEENEQPHRGSVTCHITMPRDRYSAYWRLMHDYFSEPQVLGKNLFRRRYVIRDGQHCTFIAMWMCCI
jgi:hypothetical protein